MRRLARACFALALAACAGEANPPPASSSGPPPLPSSEVAAKAAPLSPPPTLDAGVAMDAAAHTPPSEGAPDDLVDVKRLIPELLLDMRYAGRNNFVGKAIYPSARCLLRRRVAEALARVQAELEKQTLQLLIWDCYRPFRVQEQFWALVPDPRYVARPRRRQGKPFKGSKHNRGAAIDLSIATAEGSPLQMPTDHDDFSERAHRGAAGIPKQAAANAEKLHQAMSAQGFAGIATEWWHFDYGDWRDYPLADLPLGSAKESRASEP